MGQDVSALTGVRLDVWLDVACLFRTRSEAKKACSAGRVSVDGQTGKPHRLVRPGDEIAIARPFGRRQIVAVVAVSDRSLPKAQARELYEDRSPVPTPEEREMRRMDRTFRAISEAAGVPDKRQRRALRKLRGR